ncbi:hypothetical protein R3P38DRAFT_3287668 [Favolaschia claudopus]|uniref:Uncharacterized protein n=1 Tax=Favolaschia claudopus TaxID=2862362 RepID=A0AAV9ZZL2_9AGAR
MSSTTISVAAASNSRLGDFVFRRSRATWQDPLQDENFSAARPSSSPPSPASKIRNFEQRFQTSRKFSSRCAGHFIINADTPFWKLEISCSRDQASEFLGIQIFFFPLRGPLHHQ